MKPFNLNEYIANPSRKVVTRDGRSARIICTEAKGNYPVVALILTEGGEFPETYTEKGIYMNSNKSDNDLFFAPEKHEGYVTLFRQTAGINAGFVFNTKEEAEKSAKSLPNYITTVRIEWEE